MDGNIKEILKNGNHSPDHLGGPRVLKFFVVARGTVGISSEVMVSENVVYIADGSGW